MRLTYRVEAMRDVAEAYEWYESAPWSRKRLSSGIPTSRRTDRRSKAESERLERLARMTALAEEVWEARDLAHEFLLSAQPQIGGWKPVELADSDLGTRQVEEILFNLEYSLPA